MGCDIVFNINGILREGDEALPKIVIENSNLIPKTVNLTNIAKVLNSNTEIKENLIDIIENLKKYDKRAVELKDLKDGIVGNCKFHTLQYANPDGFPNISEDPDILLIDVFDFNGINIRDVIYKKSSTGGLVYVVLNSPGSIKKLYAHLRAKNSVLTSYKEDDRISAIKPIVEKALKKKFKSSQDLLIDFLTNNAPYRTSPVGRGTYGLLTETIRTLTSNSYIGYSQPLDMELNARTDKVKDSNSSILTYDLLELILKLFFPNIKLKKGWKKDEQFVKDLFTEIQKNLTELSCKVLSINEDAIVLKIAFQTLDSKLNLTYDSINEYTTKVENYRGFTIYKYIKDDKTSYIYSRGLLAPTDLPNEFTNMAQAKKAIDILYTDSKRGSFKKLFDIGLRFPGSYNRTLEVNNNIFHISGSGIQLLNIDLDKNTHLNYDEYTMLRSDLTLEDFYEHFKEQLTESLFLSLKNIVNSIESAGIFTYLINQETGDSIEDRKLTKENADKFNSILITIKNAIDNNNYLRYYVLNSHKVELAENSYKQSSYILNVIPLSDDKITVNSKYKRPLPIIGLIDEVVEHLTERFNVNAKVLTLDEVTTLFPEVPAGTKAFIRKGKIYINGSVATSADAIHEYTHLILGALKASNYQAYEKLLGKVIATEKGRNLKLFLKAKVYPNLADIDVAEEAFVKLFSEFISGKNSSEIFDTNRLETSDEALEETKEEVDKLLPRIFTLAKEDDIDSIYKGKLNNVFLQFNKDIGKSATGLDFETGKVFREASNWIAKEIKEKNIIEKC